MTELKTLQRDVMIAFVEVANLAVRLRDERNIDSPALAIAMARALGATLAGLPEELAERARERIITVMDLNAAAARKSAAELQ